MFWRQRWGLGCSRGPPLGLPSRPACRLAETSSRALRVACGDPSRDGLNPSRRPARARACQATTQGAEMSRATQRDGGLLVAAHVEPRRASRGSLQARAPPRLHRAPLEVGQPVRSRQARNARAGDRALRALAARQRRADGGATGAARQGARVLVRPARLPRRRARAARQRGVLSDRWLTDAAARVRQRVARAGPRPPELGTPTACLESGSAAPRRVGL